jgi:EAL and modified HD-GYP domain-containing signal transduction protein
VLSVVDALLDQPMDEVLKGLAVTEELRWALLGRSGRIGAVLDMAIRVEQNRRGVGSRQVSLADAIAWTNRTITGLG